MRRADGEVDVDVVDDGVGLPDGFDLESGKGLGLSIVQDIIKAYRGELSVDRSPEFGGARFSVRLPPS